MLNGIRSVPRVFGSALISKARRDITRTPQYQLGYTHGLQERLRSRDAEVEDLKTCLRGAISAVVIYAPEQGYRELLDRAHEVLRGERDGKPDV